MSIDDGVCSTPGCNSREFKITTEKVVQNGSYEKLVRQGDVIVEKADESGVELRVHLKPPTHEAPGPVSGDEHHVKVKFVCARCNRPANEFWKK